MFDRMNVHVPLRTPCVQPPGERESDDIEGESSNYQSFNKEDTNAYNFKGENQSIFQKSLDYNTSNS